MRSHVQSFKSNGQVWGSVDFLIFFHLAICEHSSLLIQIREKDIIQGHVFSNGAFINQLDVLKEGHAPILEKFHQGMKISIPTPFSFKISP